MPKRSFLLLQLIKTSFNKLFGEVTWKSPVWLQRLRNFASVRPGLLAIMLGLIVLTGAISYGAYRWYQALPKPHYITAEITAPAITPIDKSLKPDVLRIIFGIKQGQQLQAKSVAALAKIGKDVTDLVSLSPTTAGVWRWENDQQLVFTPKNDWPAAQPYQVKLSPALFAPQVKLAAMKYKFTTQPLTATIAEFKLYQDSQNPKLHQLVATLNFNFPVDTQSVADHLSLQAQQLSTKQFDAARYKFNLRFDEHKRTAFVQSSAINLTTQDSYALLVLAKGVKAATGSATTETEISQKVLLPNLTDLVRIQNLHAAIVRNEQDQPEQMLIVETSQAIKTTDLQQALQVYALPTSHYWNSPAQVQSHLLTADNKIALQAIPNEKAYSNLHSFRFKATEQQQLYVKIDKGLKSDGGYSLTRDYLTLATAPAYPKEINFLHKGALLALNSEKKLSVLIRGLPAVKFEVARILAHDINHLVTQTRGDFNNPQFIHQYDFNEKNISHIKSEIKSFAQSDAAKIAYTALDFKHYLPTDTTAQTGLFLVKAQGWDVKNNDATDGQATRLILITDMGLVVKDNADGSHDVFVASITQGQPIAEVQLQVLAKNGEAVHSVMTDPQGHAHIPSLKDFKDEREPVAYLARKANDLSFIPYQREERQLNYTRYDVGGEQTDLAEKQLTAYIFTDRGIYRPGDTVHAGIVVKQAYAKSAAADIPVEAVITDPRGMTVFKQKYALPADGFINLDYQTGAAVATGQYNMDLYIIHDGQRGSVLGSTSVQLEEFLPDRLRIKSHFVATDNLAWVSPSSLKARVSVWNLFGTPAAERKVTGKIILKPRALYFKEYPHYIFIDPLLDPKKPAKVISEDLTESKTDQQGVAEFALNLEQFGRATYQLDFYTEGYEAAGGRSVASQSSILVSPVNYLVGYHADGDLNYIKQNSQRTVNLIAINPQLARVNLPQLQAKLFALRNVASLVKKPDGTFAYQTILQEQPLNISPLTISAAGINYPLPTTAIGNFALAIVDSQGMELSRVRFSVVGASNQPLPKNAELAVKLNKPEYNPGDTIELQITAPYTGAGLITIERDKVYSYQWFKMDQTNSVQTIQIPKDFIGNGYVNVALMRDWNSPEIFISPLSYSVLPFAVNRSAHNINVDLQVPEQVRPGEQLTIKYRTAQSSELIIYAVDEGILQVTRYPLPDPLGFFFRKQALAVTTAQTLDQILPKFIESREFSSVGGDALRVANMLASHINPFKRRVDKAVVFWSGIIDADPQQRNLQYRVPDYFNGNLKVMAVAVAANAVGAAVKPVTVKGDVVINPNVPTFVAPGDEFTVSAGIANLNAGNAPLTVTIAAANNIEILGSASQTIAIAQGREQAVQFKLRAKSQLGAADIRFTVATAKGQTHMQSSLSIRPASAFTTTLTAGITSDKTRLIPVARELYPEYRSQEITASPSPLILVKGLQRYLENFPYSCTEQLVSKAFILIAFANQPVLHISAAKAQQYFTEIMQTLRERQLANGGFSYWPGQGENYSTKFASVYAMHFLTEAKQLGYAVPTDVFENGLAYLREIAAENVTSLDTARVQAYAIYLLTRNEIVTSDYVTNLQLYLEKALPSVWQHDITAAYLAATYQLLQNQTEAEQLIASYKMGATNNSGYHDFYRPMGNDAQYLSLVAKHFPQRLPQLKATQVLTTLVDGIAKNNVDTLSAAYAALALKAYDQSLTSRSLNDVSITAIDSHQQRRLLAKVQSLYQTITFAAAKQLEISNQQGQPYYYLLSQAGFDRQAATKSVAQGLEIFREYRDSEGKTLTQAKLGEEIQVHINIRSLTDQTTTNVAIVDLLPGGFEVVRDSVTREHIDYVDIREDRVIFFSYVTPDTKELIYKIKAVNVGHYTVPPIMAAAMYDPFVKAQGVVEKMEVGN